MLQTGRRDTRYRRFNRPTFLPFMVIWLLLTRARKQLGRKLMDRVYTRIQIRTYALLHVAIREFT